ncbi:helix-turn-helix transcriptional regulator [Bradyrhizobium sp. CCBAU 45321]
MGVFFYQPNPQPIRTKPARCLISRAFSLEKHVANERYLTTKEAAAHIKSSTSTLSKRRLTGDGPAFVRIGRAVRYRQADLDAWMEASTALRSTQRRSGGRAKY